MGKRHGDLCSPLHGDLLQCVVIRKGLKLVGAIGGLGRVVAVPIPGLLARRISVGAAAGPELIDISQLAAGLGLPELPRHGYDGAGLGLPPGHEDKAKQQYEEQR